MSIVTNLAAILAAKYGRDVRQAIHDSIYDVDIIADAAAVKAYAADVKADSAILKADAMANGSPKGQYATLVALEAAFPTGTTGAYHVAADNHLYFWDSDTSAWEDGGAYGFAPLITAGDLLMFTTVPERLPIGANGDVLNSNGLSPFWLPDRVLNVKNYGAIGDGTTDDATAIQDTIDAAASSGHPIYFPAGAYLIGVPLRISSYAATLYGDGCGKSFITKVNAATVIIAGTALNSVLILEGADIVLHDLGIYGDLVINTAAETFEAASNEATTVVNGITFAEIDAARTTIERVTIGNCNRAFHDFGGCWVVEFTKVHCKYCKSAFDFSTVATPKTTFVFKSCVVENCGTGYVLAAVNYSSFISCAADLVNFPNEHPPAEYTINNHALGINDNGYIVGFGNRASSLGVYDFHLCRAVTMVSCGCEKCYGNGALRFNGSVAQVVGLVSYFLKSDYVPAANYGVGPITTGNEHVWLDISGLYIETYTNDLAVNAGRPVAWIANNYAVNPYGVYPEKSIIFHTGYVGGIAVMFAGLNGSENCLDMMHLLTGPVFKTNYDMAYTRVFESRILTGSNKSIISIPVTSQASANQCHVIHLVGFDGTPNANSPAAFVANISFNSLTSVSNVTVLAGCTAGITAAGSGAALQVTLPSAYNNLLLDCSLVSKVPSLVLFASAALA